ncbi:MAG: glycosyltransferase family 2 protein [Nanoarchaeota archaeon]|nr:glycosyltransferase family 2 protein [Nanoarchaeota archaeon]
MKRIFVVIAAYNEQKTIGKVIMDLRKNGYNNIIVVDDGSKDKTSQIALKKNVFVLRHKINLGQGAALKTGIDFALEKGADIIVTFDADGQFLSKEIQKVILPIKKDKYDVVLGSRFLGTAKNIPILKKIVLKLGVVVVYMLYGIKVTDSQNGFRALSRYAAENIEIQNNRMEHAGEILHQIKKKKLKFCEVPITVLYSEYALKKGQSWSNSFNLGMKMLWKKISR